MNGSIKKGDTGVFILSHLDYIKAAGVGRMIKGGGLFSEIYYSHTTHILQILNLSHILLEQAGDATKL